MIYALEGRSPANQNDPENSAWQETMSLRAYLNYLRELREFDGLDKLTGEMILDSQILALEAILDETQK